MTLRNLMICVVNLIAFEAFAATRHSYVGDSAIHQTDVGPLASAGQPAAWSSFVQIAESYGIAQIVTGSNGSTYVAGSRYFATGSAVPAFASASDIFVAKLDSSGNTLFTVTLSGKGSDTVHAVALDPSGNIYVAGTTTSLNYPLRGALQSSAATSNTEGTAFITKLSPDGSQIIYSTYFGGTAGPSSISAIVADSNGDAFVTGTTNAANYPTTSGLPASPVSIGLSAVSGAFFAKISPRGDTLLYSGVISGRTINCSGGSSCFLRARGAHDASLALDGAGNLFIGGNGDVSDLPASSGAFLAKGIGPFIAKINTAGTSLQALTYLTSAVEFGGPGIPLTSLAGIAVDPSGAVYVAGATSDPTFPVTAGAYQTLLDGQSQPHLPAPADAFVAKFSADLSRIPLATYVGGSGNDGASALAVDAAGNILLAGSTASTDFPNVNGWTSGRDFVIRLNSAGSALTWSSLFPGGTSASIAAGQPGLIYTAGGNLVSAMSPDAPAPGIFVVENSATLYAPAQVAPGEIVALYGPQIGPSTAIAATPDSRGFFPTSLGGVQVTVNGTPAPLLYVSATQINAVMPLGVSGKTAVFQTSTSAGTTPSFYAPVVTAAPGIYRIDQTHAVALNQDGSINSQSKPAPVGSIVALWVTGVASIDPALKDGQVQTAANDTGCCRIQVQGTDAFVLYAGDAPGTVAGLSQINFKVPSNNQTRELPITLVSGTASDTASIYVQ